MKKEMLLLLATLSAKAMTDRDLTRKIKQGNPFAGKTVSIEKSEHITEESLANNDDLRDMLLARVARLSQEKKVEIAQTCKNLKPEEIFERLPEDLRKKPVLRVFLEPNNPQETQAIYVEEEWLEDFLAD